MVAESMGRAVRLTALFGLTLIVPACRGGPELPPLPELRKQNPSSIARFVEADREAREDESAVSVGRLGMLYHSYQFLDEARRCYEIARSLEPSELRWVFYAAKVEKAAFRYEAGETLFRQGLVMSPGDAELLAEIGDLYLMWGRADDAALHFEKALVIEPLQPLAALGKARLATLRQDWPEVTKLLIPLLELHPRLSRAHQYLAAAYGALGAEDERALHQDAGKYGSAVESERMRELHDLAVDAILEGDPAPGPELLQVKCARCHDHERIYDHDEDRRWWARTVRRMQREAGWDWLSDEEASSVVAYLATRERSTRAEPGAGTRTRTPSR
jgi:tetratricopeptide (TPR) repeat protein